MEKLLPVNIFLLTRKLLISTDVLAASNLNRRLSCFILKPLFLFLVFLVYENTLSLLLVFQI